MPVHQISLEENNLDRCPVPQCPCLIVLPDDAIIMAWLNAKVQKSQSWKTHVAYHMTALSLRTALRQHDSDLFVDIPDETARERFLLLLRIWASERAPASRHKGDISSSTYNQRLSIISSLYDYARKQRHYRDDNPIDWLERRALDAEKSTASALKVEDIRKLVTEITKTNSADLRDTALINVALQTGALVRAIANIHIRQLTWSGNRLSVQFPQTKGEMIDMKTLDIETSAILNSYLEQIYGPNWVEQQNWPVWVSLSYNSGHGQPLSVQAIGQIYARRLGTTKTRITRQSVALTLVESDTFPVDAQAMLATACGTSTDIYLQRLRGY